MKKYYKERQLEEIKSISDNASYLNARHLITEGSKARVETDMTIHLKAVSDNGQQPKFNMSPTEEIKPESQYLDGPEPNHFALESSRGLITEERQATEGNQEADLEARLTTKF